MLPTMASISKKKDTKHGFEEQANALKPLLQAAMTMLLCAGFHIYTIFVWGEKQRVTYGFFSWRGRGHLAARESFCYGLNIKSSIQHIRLLLYIAACLT